MTLRRAWHIGSEQFREAVVKKMGEFGLCRVRGSDSYRMPMRAQLTRGQILGALRALAAECARRGIAGEICIYGGAGMVLVFDARAATRDVDAVFRPKAEIMDAAHVVAEQLVLPSDWLNDGVKEFLSHNEELTDGGIPELEGLANLRVFAPTAEYLLAMKCMAARSEELSDDRGDVQFLVRSLGLTTAEEASVWSGDFIRLIVSMREPATLSAR